eukprot:1160099-Pelagomonas_calceolata.AAC.6
MRGCIGQLASRAWFGTHFHHFIGHLVALWKASTSSDRLPSMGCSSSPGAGCPMLLGHLSIYRLGAGFPLLLTRAGLPPVVRSPYHLIGCIVVWNFSKAKLLLLESYLIHLHEEERAGAAISFDCREVCKIEQIDTTKWSIGTCPWTGSNRESLDWTGDVSF